MFPTDLLATLSNRLCVDVVFRAISFCEGILNLLRPLFLPGTFEDIGLVVYSFRFLQLVALLLGLGGKGFEFRMIPYSLGNSGILTLSY